MPSGIYKRTKTISEETRKKLSEFRLKNPTRYWLGKKRPPFSKETKQKMSKTRKGIKLSKETRERISEAHLKSGIQPPHGKGKKCPRYIDGRCKNKKYISWLSNKWHKKKRDAEGSHTYGEWELLKKQYGYVCPCCGEKEPFNQRVKYLTQDHIIPLSKGGSDYIENIQPLCMHCNLTKHTKIIKY